MLDKTKLLSFLLSSILFITPCSQYITIVTADDNNVILFEDEYSFQDDASDELYFDELTEEDEGSESVEEIYHEDETVYEEYAESETDEVNNEESDENNSEFSELFDDGNSEEISLDVCFSDEVNEEEIQENVVEEYDSAYIDKELLKSIRAWKNEDGICVMIHAVDRNPFTYSMISLESGTTIAEGAMSIGADYQYTTIPKNQYSSDELIDGESESQTDSFEFVLSDEAGRYIVRFSNDSVIEISSINEAEDGVTVSWQGGSDCQYSVLIRDLEDGSFLRNYDTNTESIVIDAEEFKDNQVYVTSYQYDEANGYMVFSDAVLCKSSNVEDSVSEEISTDDSALAENYIGLDVDYHTKEEIITYLRAHPVIVELPFFSAEPNIKQPYYEGKLTDAFLQSALTHMNNIRYISGTPYDLELDSELNTMAQIGVLINAANDKMDHTPTKPAGMSDEMYTLGYQGTSSSDLASTVYLKLSINLWMHDTDSKTLGSLGHRRWLLNPRMKYIGFGSVKGYSAAYVFGKAREVNSYSMVAWPAQNMPVEYMESGTAWNLTSKKALDENQIQVTLIRKNDNKKWVFSKKQSDGIFLVDTVGYGSAESVCFLPKDIEYNPGDAFEVTITGIETLPIKYNVEFFSVCNGNHEFVKTIWPEPTCSEYGLKYAECKYCAKVDYSLVSKIPHNYAVDAIENGKLIWACTECGDQKIETLPKSLEIIFRTKNNVPYTNKLPPYIYAGDVISYSPNNLPEIEDKKWRLLDITTNDPNNCVVDLTKRTISFLKSGDYKLTFSATYNPNIKLKFDFHVYDPLNKAILTTDLQSPQKYGTTIRLQAEAVGGSGAYRYTFYAVDDSGDKIFLKKNSQQNYCDWHPRYSGSWRLGADITDKYEEKPVAKHSNVIDFVVEKIDISKSKVSGLKNLPYSGSAQTLSIKVKLGEQYLKERTDYSVSYKDNVKIGTATVTIKGIGNYEGTIKKTFEITKKPQKITVKPTKVSICVGDKSTISVSGNKGKISYASSDTGVAKISGKGVITAVKLGKAEIRVKVSATDEYESVEKIVKITVVPGATSSVSATIVPGGIKITWKKVQGATGYDLYADGNKIMSDKKDLSYVDKTNYYNGAKLTYTVVARTALGPSTKSNSTIWYYLQAPEITELTSRKSGRLSVWWTKNKESNGSQMQYSTDKAFKSGVKDVTVTGTDNRSQVINNLPSGKTYYVRIRRYKTVGNNKYYSQWSPVKSIKIS